MRILKRSLGLLLVVVLVAVVAAAGFLTWVTARAMPETTGTIAATGLGAPVTVARDAAGIAHITADTTTRPLLRPGLRPRQRADVADGGLAAHLGRPAGRDVRGEPARHGQVHPDPRLARRGPARPRCRRAARPGRPRRLHAGRQRLAGRHRGSLGLAFLVAGVTPEPWTNLDTIAWGKVQAWNLGGNFDSEVFRYLADAAAG